MAYLGSTAPALNWETSEAEGDVLVTHFDTREGLPHLLVIDRAVLNDRFRDGHDLVSIANDNRASIERATGRAWRSDRLEEFIEVTGTGLHNVQLRLELADFD